MGFNIYIVKYIAVFCLAASFSDRPQYCRDLAGDIVAAIAGASQVQYSTSNIVSGLALLHRLMYLQINIIYL